jgi:hypothetical protein
LTLWRGRRELCRWVNPSASFAGVVSVAKSPITRHISFCASLVTSRSHRFDLDAHALSPLPYRGEQPCRVYSARPRASKVRRSFIPPAYEDACRVNSARTRRHQLPNIRVTVRGILRTVSSISTVPTYEYFCGVNSACSRRFQPLHAIRASTPSILTLAASLPSHGPIHRPIRLIYAFRLPCQLQTLLLYLSTIT